MGEETIKKILKDFGLTEKEIEVYIFLSKHGALKCGDIAKSMKRHRAQIYRILKILENKGLLESIIETPMRFAPISFEKALDLSIKTKQEEARLIEETRKEVATYWKELRHSNLELSLQKFVIIEGKRIFPKITQMIKETQEQLSCVLTITDFLRANNLGLLDAAFTHSLKSKAHFRFLTEVSNQYMDAAKTFLLNHQTSRLNFKVRNPELGLQLSPRIVIKDKEQMLFFITNHSPSLLSDDVCMWTNCRELVHSFSSVFDDLWRNSIEIQTKLMELKTGIPIPQTYIISEPKLAQQKYYDFLDKSKDEIIMITSAEGLMDYSKKITLLKKWANKGVFVKIMAPIVKENYTASQRLLESCYVKHIPANYLNTTLIDGQHLFQFKNSALNEKASLFDFQDTFYSSNAEYVGKTKNMLNDIWTNAHKLSDSILLPFMELNVRQGSLPLDRFDEYKHMIGWLGYPEVGVITEKEIVDKIINAKRVPAKDPKKDIAKYYGSRGFGVIHPPESFNLPKLVIIAFHFNKESSFGAEDRLMINMWINGPDGPTYMPVATVSDNSQSVAFHKGTQKGTPSALPQLVNNDELQVRLQGNTLFAGWTVPLRLHPPNRFLPPACLTIEAYNDYKTAIRRSKSPSGRMQITEFVFSEANLTFYHPASKYSGPGTDAFLHRDIVGTTYPPPLQDGTQT